MGRVSAGRTGFDKGDDDVDTVKNGAARSIIVKRSRAINHRAPPPARSAARSGLLLFVNPPPREFRGNLDATRPSGRRPHTASDSVAQD